MGLSLLQYAALSLTLGAAVLSLTACTNARNYTNENDQLRAERLELKSTIETLETRLAQREAEVKAIREQIGETQPTAVEVQGVEPPRLAGLVLGMYSGPIDLDGDRRYDAIRAYVRPVDQHGRQITAVGTARLQLIAMQTADQPITLVDQQYDAQTFHKAYRSGITGTHYTLAADLPDDPPTTATLLVTLTDAETGRRYAAEKKVQLVRTASKD